LGLIPLTYNEIQHLFATLSLTSATGYAGLRGDAGTRPTLVPATTAPRPLGNH
jgi:hypothetical protein